MKVIFLDNDGVICLDNNWGGRTKKWKEYKKINPEELSDTNAPVYYRFDDFDKKAIKVLNSILEETGAEIVVSSDWKLHATLEELQEYYLKQGIVKSPIAFTKRYIGCDRADDFVWHRGTIYEQQRALEINQFITDHPEITHWVAVDDLKLGIYPNMSDGSNKWGLANFVETPRMSEGIKQSGIKEQILGFLK
jgi:hypothetical protein